jgi:hypothetical protein
MKKSCEFLILVLLFNFLQGCTADRSKRHYKTTYKNGDHLFVEVFTIFGSGAFGGDRLSEYLTDSISFRKYVGTFDDNAEAISYKMVIDSIYIEKYSLPGRNTNLVSEKQTYNINSLKKENRFE